ncbi:transcriptional regulator [Paenibacillus pectinilyticus]|uniref:Transcriptional regulator n=1 Tax=Paenibacillus pectinilyticus TaxID=512399 RepID=A0A1C0ZTQ0_9BACL|nr:TetR/AcrR family transcriptional regulator [Paenibacillus pectinilyticus]OCT11431.1 transcriptional regulator [Paenibacillus pectinilyticus]
MGENRKVQYTKRVIRESYLSLLSKKPIGKITVAEICKLADINRGTFYQHYKDVYHLQEIIEDELYIKFERMQPLRKENNFSAITFAAVSLIYEEKELCHSILGKHGNTPFIERVFDLCRQNTFEMYEKIGISGSDSNYIYNYLLSGSTGIIQTWVESDFNEAPEAIVNYIDNLSRKGLSAYSKHVNS